MATAFVKIDTDKLAADVVAELLDGGSLVLVSRKDIEHVALSMMDCFHDVEEPILNRLRAAVGASEVTKTGTGAGRGWVKK